MKLRGKSLITKHYSLGKQTKIQYIGWGPPRGRQPVCCRYNHVPPCTVYCVPCTSPAIRHVPCAMRYAQIKETGACPVSLIVVAISIAAIIVFDYFCGRLFHGFLGNIDNTTTGFTHYSFAIVKFFANTFITRITCIASQP